jgi:hypothetical protein
MLTAMTVLGCTGAEVRTDKDPGVNLAGYQTFQVKSGDVRVEGVVDKRDTLMRDRVESALLDELLRKGLAPSTEDPDLIATYATGTRRVTEVDYDDGIGWGWGNTGAWVDEYTENTLLIDLVDSDTNKLVWRSVVEMDDEDMRKPENISAAVDKAFEKYPGL